MERALIGPESDSVASGNEEIHVSREAPDVEMNALVGEKDWESIERFNHASDVDSFVSGEPSGRRIRIRYFRRTNDDALMARVWLGPGAQGPPGHAHGGALAAALDEAMGFSAWALGYRVVAAHIEVDFRAMVPLESVTTIEARVIRVAGRKLEVKARLERDDGVVAAESTGLFIQLSPEQMETLGRLASVANMDPEAFA
jgi:acyl-coenzyme A thioesterase PaaI-like protein